MNAISKIRPTPPWRILRHAMRGRSSIVLALHGPLAAAELAGLRAPLQAVLQDPADHVVLDLADATWLDGSGVAAIGYLFKRLAASGRRLSIAGACGQPREMLAELGLAAILAPPPGQPVPMAEHRRAPAPAGPPRPRVALRLVRAR